MFIYLNALAVMLGGGVLALFCGKRSKAATVMGTVTLIASSAVIFTALVLDIFLFREVSVEQFFQIPIAVLGFAAALFSPGYLAGHEEKRSSYYYFFLNLTICSMYCTTLLKTPFHFLIAWELMGLASAALVMFDYHSEKSKKAAFFYFAACHAGAAFLIPLFVFPYLGIFFPVLALIGFGLKIGFPLLHVWLPEAHPAAPAPVSAIMSGAMIELGFLGLILFLPGKIPPYFSYILLFLGLTGALWGIICALAQNNLKRLLAYSSMENMGICSIAFALALLGKHHGLEAMSNVALCGGFLHIINHAFLKGGLFLGAGAVLKSCGTLEMDKIGGLMKRAPHTGTLFTLNAAGLCALPPFNGFISEFLIYYAAFQGLLLGTGVCKTASAISIIVLAVTGGLAAAVMAKAVSGVFLGEPRSREAAEAKEVTKMMRASMYILFLLSLLSILLTPTILSILYISGISHLKEVLGITFILACISFAVILFLFLLLLLQNIFCRGGKRISATWDCGYAKPDARMQYTPTAFTQPLTDFFASVLRTEKKITKAEKLFAEEASYEAKTEDTAMKYFWEKLFKAAIACSEKLRFLQSGNLHGYIFMILLVLGGMLIYAVLTK